MIMKILLMVMWLCLVLIIPRFVDAEIPTQGSDAKVLGVIVTIDQDEIQEAELAQQKKINPNVLDYAMMLNKEHSQHLGMTRDLAKRLGITIIDNTATIKQISTKCKQDISALTTIDGDAFAQLYIADMIKDHSTALNWLNSQASQQDEIKNLLKDTASHVDMHLKKAQSIHEDQTKGQT
jgi:putative membrane protein